MSEREESLAAAKRIREALARATSIGNPSLIVTVADLKLLIDTLGALVGPRAEERAREANTELDAMIAADNLDLDGVPMQADRAWVRYEIEGAATAAMMTSEQRLLMRSGFLAGYINGVGKERGHLR